MGKDGICFDDYATGYEAMICVRVHCAYLVRVVAKRLSRLVGLGFDMWGISGLDPTAGCFNFLSIGMYGLGRYGNWISFLANYLCEFTSHSAMESRCGAGGG